MLTYEAKSGAYSIELDETRFVLDVNLLTEALEITPIDQAHQFVSHPSGDAIMDFVNELGYTEVIHFVSRMAVNNPYQPWRAILSMTNQCLTGKTFGHDRPRYPAFLTDKANLGSPTKKGRKDKPHIIPYCRFMKRIISKHDRKITAEHGGKKKLLTTKKPKPKPIKEKSSKPASVPKPKATKEKPAKPSPAKPLKMGKRRTLAMEEASTGPSAQPHDETSTNIVHESPFTADAELYTYLTDKGKGSPTLEFKCG
nr:hypothetical protein [Tanacetum cinerariifolium]